MKHYGSILGERPSSQQIAKVKNNKTNFFSMAKSCFCISSEPQIDQFNLPIPQKKHRKSYKIQETVELEKQIVLKDNEFQLVGQHNQIILCLRNKQLKQSQVQFTTQDSMCQYLQQKNYFCGNICIYQVRPCLKLAHAVLESSDFNMISIEQNENESFDQLLSSQKQNFRYSHNKKIADLMITKNQYLRSTNLFDRIIICPYMTSSNYEYHIEEKKIVKFIAKHLRSVDVFENLIILLPNTFSYQSIIKIIEIEDKVFQEKYHRTFKDTPLNEFAKYVKCTGLYFKDNLQYTLIKIKLIKQSRNAIQYTKIKQNLGKNLFFCEKLSEKLEDILDQTTQHNILQCIYQVQSDYFSLQTLKNKQVYHQYLNILINNSVLKSGQDLHLLESILYSQQKLQPIDVQFQVVVEKDGKGSGDIEGYSFSLSEKLSHDKNLQVFDESNDKIMEDSWLDMTLKNKSVQND